MYLCWSQLERVKLYPSKNLITKCYRCRGSCLRCLAGSSRSQPSVTYCGFLFRRSPCFSSSLQVFLHVVGVAEIHGNGWSWCLCVKCQFGKCSFSSHVTSVFFTGIHCQLPSLVLFIICLRNVCCVSSSDLLWGIGKLFIPSVQWKIKVRSRIKLLKHKCLVLFGLLQGILHKSRTFLLSSVLTASPKWISYSLCMGNWVSFRSPLTIKRVKMASVGLSYSYGHLVPFGLPYNLLSGLCSRRACIFCVSCEMSASMI